MTPDQAAKIRNLAHALAEKTAFYNVGLVDSKTDPKALRNLAGSMAGARKALHEAIASLTEPVLAVVPRGIDPDDADFVGINFDTAIQLLDREPARSKA